MGDALTRPRDLTDWSVPADRPLEPGEAGLFVAGHPEPTHVAAFDGPVVLTASTRPGSGELFTIGHDARSAATSPVALTRYECELRTDGSGQLWIVGAGTSARVAVSVRRTW